MHESGLASAAQQSSIPAHLLVVAGECLLPARRGLADFRLAVAAARGGVARARYPRHLCLVGVLVRRRRHDRRLRHLVCTFVRGRQDTKPSRRAVMCGIMPTFARRPKGGSLRLIRSSWSPVLRSGILALLAFGFERRRGASPIHWRVLQGTSERQHEGWYHCHLKRTNSGWPEGAGRCAATAQPMRRRSAKLAGLQRITALPTFLRRLARAKTAFP